MTLSLNSSVLPASAFYDHHRHISQADFDRAVAKQAGDGADPAALNGVNTASGGAGGAEPEGFSFFDLLDIINPLQHIPIVSSIYRAITGDEINGPARILGGALYGGPVGLASGVINAAVDEASGHDVGEHVMMAFLGDDAPDLPPPLKPADKAPVMVAENAQPDSPSDTDTQFRAGPRMNGGARDARTLAQNATPLLAEEAARDAAMASALLQENDSRAEARAGDGAPTPPSPAAQPIQQPTHMPTALQPPLAPGMVVQTMMENLDSYGDMQRSRNAGEGAGDRVATPEGESDSVYNGYYFGS